MVAVTVLLLVELLAPNSHPYSVTSAVALAVFAALAALGLDSPPNAAARSLRLALAPLPALLFVVLPALYFERQWHGEKGYMTNASPFRESVDAVARNAIDAPGPLHLVADQSTCYVFHYYLSYHPKRTSRGRKLGAHTLSCSDDEADLKTVLGRVLDKEPHAAWVFTWEPRALARARRSWLRGCQVAKVAVVRRVSLVHVSCPAS